MIRKLVERLSREKYFIRNLPSEFSRTPLFVSPDAQLKYLKPGVEGFDKELLNIVSEYISKGDVVWDIGSNVGVFAFAAASIAGRNGHVLAVEPDIWLANLLQKSARLHANQNLSVDVLPAAIADSCGIANFLVADRGRASNALAKTGGRCQMGGYREKNLVPMFSLDDLLKISAKPNFIKIDVEGAEVNVLQGAQEILSDVRPVIYCEVGVPYRAEITEIFRAADYKIFDSGLPQASRFDIEKCGFNTLAYPSESLRFNDSGTFQVVCTTRS
ncbi:FkbM family methyltransferase [Leptolyngbyaceae cyanobacterium CCMR0082]|uniref:FkbM family methyltransferase n=1 Tax=Adonisia turfae CCMR0082 TaxID=2304604 RepID=A0A6M0SBG0_9CYAN|nr:FkbM family methyltransferase [Adonisia turfae]NEZ65800.1 FkbM family methyltransferase [Adonisia turfae CCMR0082]